MKKEIKKLIIAIIQFCLYLFTNLMVLIITAPMILSSNSDFSIVMYFIYAIFFSIGLLISIGILSLELRKYFFKL
jgi:hypothetical protein